MVLIFLKNNVYYSIRRCQRFFYSQGIIRINFDICVIVKKTKCDTTFLTYKVSNPILSIIMFLRPNNTKNLLPSSTLINLSIFSKLIRIGFAPTNILHEVPSMKIISCDFLFIKIYQNQNLQI